jgi:hypothetical protein
MGFYCKIGDVETTIPWLRPNLETLKKWYEEFSKVPGISNYDIYVLGNFAEKTWGTSTLDTWDCDITLNGDIKDNYELKFIMDEAVRIGFNNRIFLDVWHNSELFSFEGFSPLTQTRAFNTFYKERDGEVISDYTIEHLEPQPGGLFSAYLESPTNSIIKALNRYSEGIYQGIQKPLEDIMSES